MRLRGAQKTRDRRYELNGLFERRQMAASGDGLQS
jgi:hypothetical protein